MGERGMVRAESPLVGGDRRAVLFDLADGRILFFATGVEGVLPAVHCRVAGAAVSALADAHAKRRPIFSDAVPAGWAGGGGPDCGAGSGSWGDRVNWPGGKSPGRGVHRAAPGIGGLAARAGV